MGWDEDGMAWGMQEHPKGSGAAQPSPLKAQHRHRRQGSGSRGRQGSPEGAAGLGSSVGVLLLVPGLSSLT